MTTLWRVVKYCTHDHKRTGQKIATHAFGDQTEAKAYAEDTNRYDPLAGAIVVQDNEETRRLIP